MPLHVKIRRDITRSLIVLRLKSYFLQASNNTEKSANANEDLQLQHCLAAQLTV